MLEISMTNLISVGVFVLGAMWGLMKIIAIQGDRALNARFVALNVSITAVNDGIAKDRENTQRMEREFLQFKVEVSRDRVHRDDFIRAVGTIETKIDNFSLRMERAMLTGRKDA